MSAPIPTERQLDPQPFRDWCERRLEASERLGRDDVVADLANELGVAERQLYRWRFEVRSLGRRHIEDALHRAGVGLWELYPRAVPKFGGRRFGSGNLTDDQVRSLHRLHIDGGYSITALGERIWIAAGYRSAKSAAVALGRAFRRRDLPTRAPNVAAPRRRCKGTKSQYPRKGERCRRLASSGSDFCARHDPARREAVLAAMATMSPRERIGASA